MLVVAIVGILAVLAVYGVSRYVSHAKATEARNSLGQIGKDAVSVYAKEGMPGGVLTQGASAAVSRTLCTSASAKVPSAKTSIQGRKYQSSSKAGVDWQVDDGTQGKGFACLKFAITDAQYFMYNYTAVPTTGPNTGSMSATAEGDLDGDGATSTFTMNGKVQAGELNLAPNLDENQPDE